MQRFESAWIADAIAKSIHCLEASKATFSHGLILGYEGTLWSPDLSHEARKGVLSIRCCKTIVAFSCKAKVLLDRVRLKASFGLRTTRSIQIPD